MSRIFAFLEREPHGFWRTFGAVALGWLVAFAWAAVVGSASHIFTPDIKDLNNIEVEGVVRQMQALGDSVWLPIGMMVGLGIAEEFVFRIVPLSLGVRFLPRVGLVALVLVSSALFGYAHGFQNLAWGPIARTAGMGLVLCAVFLKCGGLHGKLVKPALCAAGFHGFQNLIAGMFIVYVTAGA